MRRLRRVTDLCGRVLRRARIEDKFCALVLIAMTWGGVDYAEAVDIVAEAYPIAFEDTATLTAYLERVLIHAGEDLTSPDLWFEAMGEVVNLLEN